MLLIIDSQMTLFKTLFTLHGRVYAGSWLHCCRSKASCLFLAWLKRQCLATGVYSQVDYDYDLAFATVINVPSRSDIFDEWSR